MESKSVIVTGGSKGLGRGITKVFASEGARVLVVARQQDAGERTVKEIADAGGTASFFRADVSSSDDVKAMVSCPTVREPDGLAMSSRNASLTDAQRRQAAGLYEVMRRAASKVSEGVTDVSLLIRQMEAGIAAAGPCRIDSRSSGVHPESLSPGKRSVRAARAELGLASLPRTVPADL